MQRLLTSEYLCNPTPDLDILSKVGVPTFVKTSFLPSPRRTVSRVFPVTAHRRLLVYLLCTYQKPLPLNYHDQPNCNNPRFTARPSATLLLPRVRSLYFRFRKIRIRSYKNQFNFSKRSFSGCLLLRVW